MDPELEKALAALGTNLDRANDAMFKRNEEFRQEIVDRIDAIEAGNGRPQLAQSPANDAFKNYIRHGKEGISDAYRAELVKNDDVAGGYITAPPQFEAVIVKTVSEFSPIRQYATVQNITTGGVILPIQTEAPTAHWVGETEDRGTGTTIKYGQVTIDIHEASAFIDVSAQLLEDAAINVEQEVGVELGKAFARLEAAAYMAGDGFKKPLGILNTAGVEVINSGLATEITATR